LAAGVAALVGCGAGPEHPAAAVKDAAAGAAATVNRLTPEEKAAGWILLFDGVSLDGWEDQAKTPPPGDSWVVEDGWIKAVDHPKRRKDLFTSRSFGNFELEWQWKISEQGNSGVKYRVQDRVVLVKGRTYPNAKHFEDIVNYELLHPAASRDSVGPNDAFEEYAIAFEYQMIDNLGNADAKHGADRTTGAIYSMVAPSSDASKPAGEVNTSKIVLRGNHVEHWLNGVKVVDADLGSEQIRNGLAKRWTTGSPVYKLLTEQPKKETPIGLQNHNNVVWFRAIKIRPL